MKPSPAPTPLQDSCVVLASEMTHLTWKEQIASFTPSEIIAVLACPQATAYSWKRADSPRQPPRWLQPLILRELRRARLK